MIVAFSVAPSGGRAGSEPDSVHEAVAACVHTHGLVEPVPEWIEPYRELRARYRALYPALTAVG